MTSKRLSPGAALLRHSRLMSLPPPLPPPSTHMIFREKKAPYPTHQAIATTDSSRARGDWGLKRNLPLKVSQKYLKYKELDTLEHRTTFESAHGEVLFVKKWQEMGIPITKPSLRGGVGLQTRENAFEEINWIDDNGKPIKFDETGGETKEGALSSGVPLKSTPASTKWRYDAPFLQDLTPGELRDYILKKVKPRRKEFWEYVRAEQSRESGFLPPLQRPKDTELTPVTPDQRPVDIDKLRADPFMLERHLKAFLDLPTFIAPPQTHPSAGLYYTRANSHLRNDPFTGPQPLVQQTIPGRVFGRTKDFSLAGVAGTVAKVLEVGSTTFSDNKNSYENRSMRENREIVRHWSLELAGITSEGAVDLSVTVGPTPMPNPSVEEIVAEQRKVREAERLMKEHEEQKATEQAMRNQRPSPGQGQDYGQYGQYGAPQENQYPQYEQPYEYQYQYEQATYQPQQPQQQQPENYPYQPQTQQPGPGYNYNDDAYADVFQPQDGQQQQQPPYYDPQQGGYPPYDPNQPPYDPNQPPLPYDPATDPYAGVFQPQQDANQPPYNQQYYPHDPKQPPDYSPQEPPYHPQEPPLDQTQPQQSSPQPPYYPPQEPPYYPQEPPLDQTQPQQSTPQSNPQEPLASRLTQKLATRRAQQTQHTQNKTQTPPESILRGAFGSATDDVLGLLEEANNQYAQGQNQQGGNQGKGGPGGRMGGPGGRMGGRFR